MSANNTVVTASDHGYIWGVYLLICSMRKNQMNEPVAVYGSRYTEQDCRALMSLGGVTIELADKADRSMTCSKPEAIFLAKTDYITWIDGDGFFVGNCSDNLIYEDTSLIHIRKRGVEENKGPISEKVLEVWKKDVGERQTPRFNTPCNASSFSFYRSYLPFIQRWSAQMKKLLPVGDVGVVDTKLGAYAQIDESVLNSLLCFGENVPTLSPDYKLDKVKTGKFFAHFGGIVKPWDYWTPRGMRVFSEYTSLVDWAQSEGKVLPGPVPFSLHSDKKRINGIISKFSNIIGKVKKARKRLGIG